jgi:hypothetical protein
VVSWAMIVDTRGRTWQKNLKWEYKKESRKKEYLWCNSSSESLEWTLLHHYTNCFVSFQSTERRKKKPPTHSLTHSLTQVRYISIFLFCFYAITSSSNIILHSFFLFSNYFLVLNLFTEMSTMPLFSHVLFLCAS